MNTELENKDLTSNDAKPVLSVVLKDKNGTPLKNGSVINIHQTVNGENIFVMIDVEKLDLRYGFDLSYEYQYAVTDLLASNHFNGDIEWEIIGNLNDVIKNYR